VLLNFYQKDIKEYSWIKIEGISEHVKLETNRVNAKEALLGRIFFGECNVL
jgi:hypothetical protein